MDAPENNMQSMSEAERLLSGQLQAAETELERLEQALAAADEEIEALEETRRHFELLEEACKSLQKLSQEGVSELFWGDRVSDAESRLDHAGAQIDAFREELKRAEEKRKSAVVAVHGQQDAVDFLDDDLLQAQRREEHRRREWIIEREETEFPDRLMIMPWMRGFEDDQRYRKTLLGAALASLILGLIIPFIEIPIRERNELIEVPERFAKLIRKVDPQPVAPPKPVTTEPEEMPPEETKPEVKPEEPKQAAAEPKPQAKTESAKERVRTKGLLAFKNNFKSMSANRAAKLGSAAKINSVAATGAPERAMITTQAPGSSGGINLAALSRDVGAGDGGVMEGVAITQVESNIGGGGPDGRPLAASGVAGRTDEEIQIVFDRYKAALYRLYNRELRKDPTLRGQMVLKLTIEPDGTVSHCALQRSDMNAPDLAQQVVTSVSAFNFGAKDVPAITILYPIDFLPTA